MPDIRALLHESAAQPSAPIDLDELRGSSTRRRTPRRRAVLLLAIVAIIGTVGLALVLTDDPPDRVEIVGPADEIDLATWSGLAQLAPETAWQGIVQFDRGCSGQAFGADTETMRAAFGFDPSDFELCLSGGEPPAEVTLATGTFDTEAIDTALRSDPQWAPLLETSTYRGRSFHSWGDDYAIVGPPSPGRPLGRGGRLLVTDGLVVWTQGSDEMRAVIDRLEDGPLIPPAATARLLAWAEQDGVVSLSVIPRSASADEAEDDAWSAMALGWGPSREGWLRPFGAIVLDRHSDLREADVQVAIDDLRQGTAPTVDPLEQAGADELARKMADLDESGRLHLRATVDEDGFWLSFDFPQPADPLTGDLVDNPTAIFSSVLRALSAEP